MNIASNKCFLIRMTCPPWSIYLKDSKSHDLSGVVDAIETTGGRAWPRWFACSSMHAIWTFHQSFTARVQAETSLVSRVIVDLHLLRNLDERRIREPWMVPNPAVVLFR